MNTTKLMLEAAHIQTLRDQLFEVKKIQLHPNIDGFNSPDSYGVYRTTGGDPLGVVGSSYEPTQPTFLFDQFVDALQDFDNADISKLKVTELKGGSKLLLSAPIGEVGFKNLRGLEDTMELYVNLQTGFDGLTKSSMFLSSYRLVCSNGMKAYATEFRSSFKNTKGNVGKVNLLVADVRRAVSSGSSFKEMINTLNSRKVTAQEVDEYILKVTGINAKEYHDMTTRKRNILDAINRSIATEFRDTGATAWGLVNAMTRYTNHEASTSNRMDYLFADSGAKINDLAQSVALDYLN